MTAVLSMCLSDGAFVATDSGFESGDDDAEGPRGRTFVVDRHAAVSGAGHEPAIRRVTLEVRERLAEDGERSPDELLGLVKRTVRKAAATAGENHPDVDTTFQVVVSGYDAEQERGYVAVVDSPDADDPAAVVKTDVGDVHISGSNAKLLRDVHSSVQPSVVTQYEGTPLDAWASNVVAIAASKDDAITQPVHFLRLGPADPEAGTSDGRVTDPDDRFDVDL